MEVLRLRRSPLPAKMMGKGFKAKAAFGICLNDGKDLSRQGLKQKGKNFIDKQKFMKMCPVCSGSDTVAGFRVYICIGQAWTRLQKDLNADVGVHDGLKKNRESLIDFEEGRRLIEHGFKRKKTKKRRIWYLYINCPGVGKNRLGIPLKGLVLG